VFDSRLGQETFLLAFSPTIGPTQPPIQWVQGAVSPGAKRQGSEGTSPSSGTEFRMVEPYLHFAMSLHGMMLIKLEGNFAFFYR
jgi:hypothetical protein